MRKQLYFNPSTETKKAYLTRAAALLDIIRNHPGLIGSHPLLTGMTDAEMKEFENYLCSIIRPDVEKAAYLAARRSEILDYKDVIKNTALVSVMEILHTINLINAKVPLENVVLGDDEKRNSYILKTPTTTFPLLETEKGTTQIDHVVVSKYGVFAIETKNYRGDIYGDDNRQQWTQIIVTDVRYRRKWYKTYTHVTKNHFYNPVKQSLGHSYVIRRYLSEWRQIKVIPIVVFAGYANINNIRSNYHVIYASQLIATIQNYHVEYLSDSDEFPCILIL